MSGLPERLLVMRNRNPSAYSCFLNILSGLLPLLRLAARARRVVVEDRGLHRMYVGVRVVFGMTTISLRCDVIAAHPSHLWRMIGKKQTHWHRQ
jgi:hypothetical protein